MRLVSLRQERGTEAALDTGDHLVPVHGPLDRDEPMSMEALLREWPDARGMLQEADERSPDDHEDAIARSGADLAAPVPDPPSFRDFYAFEEHVSRSWKRRGSTVPDAWYEVPVFYFSNPSSMVGPGRVVERPASTQELDFELEVGWVIGEQARDLDPSEAWDAIVGLMVLNDFSARDVQRREMSVGLGPSKGKDFATGAGPCLVTLDELADARRGEHLDLEMRARVNGEAVSRGNLADLHYSIAEMTAHASRDATLRPGEVMGTGTVGTGCILDLGTDGWLEPGDEVELEVERLGVLRHEIGAAL